MSWIITGTQKNNFSPLDLPLALWLDATDASTITLSGSSVAQWNDKSGNGRNAIPPNGQAPGYNATGLNGNGIITFDGVSQYLNTSDFYQENWYIIVVGRTNNASAQQTIVGKFDGVTNRELLMRFNSANQLLGLINPVGSSGAANTVVATAATVGTSFGVFGYYKNGSSCELGINGSIETGSFNTSTVHDGNRLLRIGTDEGFVGGGSFLNGSLQHIVITQGAPSSADMRKLEGWAAWSAGLQSLLPVNHPYKTAFPVP